jgi:hypothetical protein
MSINDTAHRNTTAPSERLRRAAVLIAEALTQLDMRTAACKDCGHKRHSNQDHFTVYDRLKEIPDKLQVMATRLDAAGDDNDNQHIR